MRRTSLLASILFNFCLAASAQMQIGADTLYGNEWINYDQTYFKTLVAQDGMYRIPAANLPSAFAGLDPQGLRMYYFGEEVPIYVYPNGDIDFFGVRNRGEMDRFLYANPEDQFNQHYSLFTDSSAYFLTWAQGQGLRYEEVENDLTDLPEKEGYYWEKVVAANPLIPIKNKITGVGNRQVERSLFQNAEGWCLTNPANFVINLSSIYSDYTGQAPVSVQYAHLRADNASPVAKTINFNGFTTGDSFSFFEGKTNAFSVPANILTEQVTVSITGGSNTCLSNVALEYPRQFDARGDSTFILTVKASGEKKYLEVENFSYGDQSPILYDLVNRIRIETSVENDVVRISLPASAQDRKLDLVQDKGLKTTGAFKAVTFIDYRQSNAEFLIVFNKALAIDGNGVNQVGEYLNHRKQTFIADTFEIQQLYDQFAYGINRHPMSIHNLVFFGKKNWTNPQYLLLIGKGREYPNLRTSDSVIAHNDKTFFIPTFGYTGADYLFVSPIGSIDPMMAVGRLPVVNANEIRIYLDKVKEFEEAPLMGSQNIQDKAWMKRVLHLGGGREAFEKVAIKAHLTGMENSIKNNRFGGIVKAIYNESSDPVLTSATGEIIQLINGGLSLITFFGHSSATVLDFNFDDPDSYDNQGKYPAMLSFGCLSGEAFNASRGLGERFIIAEKKGMIAFISSPGYGFISSLNILGNNYYQRLGGNMYGESIGNILKETLKVFAASSFDGDRMLGEQTSIQGDPSLLLNPRPAPDYLTDPASVIIQPNLLTTSTDSFNLSFDLWNIGQHLPDTILAIKIEHELPDNSVFTLLTDTVPAPPSRAPLSYTLPIVEDDQLLVGVNRFRITVDAHDHIEEKPLEAENNNDYIGPDGIPGLPVYISSADAEPLYPPNFGIVNTAPVQLNASTGNPFSPLLTYWMEIDTTEKFDSPLKQTTQIQQSGGVIKWTPTIAYQPNTVYYWRVSPDSSVTGSYRWRTHSFVYLPNGSPGWNQSHYFQFQYDEFLDMKLPDTRKLAFIDNYVDFKIRNNARNLGLKDPQYFRNNLGVWPVPDYMSYNGQGGIQSGLFFGIMDSVNVNAISFPTTPQGAWTPASKRSLIFRTDTPAQRAQVVNFLENIVPDGYYVLMFTCQNGVDKDYKPQEWENDSISIFDVLEAQGANQIRDLATIGARPYNLFYRKNRQPTFLTSERLGDFQTLTELNIPVPGTWTEGSITSPPIGPAQKWETLECELSGFNAAHDKVTISIWGMPVSGPDTLLYVNVYDRATTFPLDKIDAAKFPRIKLEYYAKDPTQKSPPHLEFWRVHYVGIPEAALDPNTHFALQSDTIQQGAPLLLEIATENLSDYDMDSLLVRYTIVNTQNQASLVEKRYRPLPARDTLIAHLQFDTRHATGLHQLIIDVNPDDDQPEQTHINNVGQLQFFVQRDQRNPLLDVTFDGMRIMDGDLISTKPFIQVQLKDENPYLALEDTSLFRLLLVHPGGLEERLYFTDERIRFYPAEIQNGKNNRARVEFEPVFTEDGLYDFYIEASDATGNKTGDINHVVSLSTFGYDYKISFKIVAESMISKVLNYPNPFSTSTRFLYTLTGDEPPAYFTIQILTVSGRVVREITHNEIGPMKIGTHLTEYAWDGRDDFGDPLANGVYLYRVAAKKANGENFKAYASGADSFFEKGYGKMVIIR